MTQTIHQNVQEDEDRIQEMHEDRYKGHHIIECSEEECLRLRKKNKTLISLVIIFGGVAVGSFFVDIVQLFSQRGFSARALQDAQVIEYDGYTWTRYDDPKVVVDVFDADDCIDCVTDDVLVRLRSLVPTMEAHRIDVRTEEGRQYAQKNDIHYIPAFIFDDAIIDSDFYQQAAILFKDNGNAKQYFDASSAGIPIGEYLNAPSHDEGIVLGDVNAPVTIVFYVDFLAENSNDMELILEKIQEDYQENVNVIIKLVPNVTVKNASKVARGLYCAYEQGFYESFMQVIEENRKTLIETNVIGDELMTRVQNLSVDNDAFAQCIDSTKSSQRIEKNSQEALKFGVAQTPQFFINEYHYSGVVTYQSVKDQIDMILSGESQQ